VPGTNRLVATVGHAAAREIMFSARRYSADEARAMGLVSRVLPDAELDDYVRSLALELAANAPLTIAASKSVINALIAPKAITRSKEDGGALHEEQGLCRRPAGIHGERAPAFKGK